MITVDLSSKNKYTKTTFGRALKTQEKPDFISTAQQAIEQLGANGKKILIVPDTCLPQSENNKTGVGNLSSRQSADFFDFANTYFHVNHIQLLPTGEIEPRITKPEIELAAKENRATKQFYCNYSSSSMSLGTHQADLELLTQPKWDSILSKEDLNIVVKANNAPSDYVNYENVVGKEINQNGKTIFEESPHNKALRKAFDNFKTSTDPKALELKEKFENYKKTEAERLESKALFGILAKEHGTYDWNEWNSELDKNLYAKGPDSNKVNERKVQLNKDYAKDIEFYKFQQFVADEHLAQGKKMLNDKGQKLILDCPIGFAKDEVWANQSAFKKYAYIGNPDWKLPALDYDKIHNPDGSLGEAGKLLEKKFEFSYKRADAVRFDVGWAYVKPLILHPVTQSEAEKILPNLPHDEEAIKEHCGVEYFHEEGSQKLYTVQRYDLKDKIIKLAENTAKKIKGNDFDLNNLTYEVAAGVKEFTAFNWANNQHPEVIEPFKGRNLIFSTEYMSDGWGSVDFFTNKAQINPDNLTIGAANHDPLPLRQLAEGMGEHNQKSNHLKPLSEFLKISQEKLNDSKEFAKAKFAELFTGAKNHMFFYMDVLGKKERFDSQEKNTSKNYRYKITDSFERNYHESLQDGHGFNLMDALGKAFKAKGLDQKHPELYKKIIDFSNILTEKGAKTEREANDTVIGKKPEDMTPQNPIPPEPPKSNKKLYAIVAGALVIGGILLYLLLKNKESSKSKN